MTENKVDLRYYRNVASRMTELDMLPKPRKRLSTGDGEFLPLILVECER